MANCVDSGQTLQNVASDKSLHTVCILPRNFHKAYPSLKPGRHLLFENRPVQIVMVEEATRHKWVAFFIEVLFRFYIMVFRPYDALFAHRISILFVLRFHGPVNPMGSCRARSVYLTTHLLGRLSPLSGSPVLCTFFRQKLTTALLESAEGRE